MPNGFGASESCDCAFDLRGAVEGSRILTPAKNGTVRLNLSSFERSGQVAVAAALDGTGR